MLNIVEYLRPNKPKKDRKRTEQVFEVNFLITWISFNIIQSFWSKAFELQNTFIWCQKRISRSQVSRLAIAIRSKLKFDNSSSLLFYRLNLKYLTSKHNYVLFKKENTKCIFWTAIRARNHKFKWSEN